MADAAGGMNDVGSESAGARFREALERERPLQIVGAVNAYAAKLAENAGFKALYLSGAGVANCSLAIPDIGATSLADVLIDARRITRATSLPLLVDADTGWEEAEGVGRTVRELIAAGVAAVQLEDQVARKKCGHLAGKQLVTVERMEERIHSAVDARTDRAFVVMARTDAVASEGLEAAVERARRYQAAGADMIFAEALTELADYREFTRQVKVPVLANVTEFGKTPLFTIEQLDSAGVSMVLYPLSAFRAMSAAAEEVYEAIRTNGTQAAAVSKMQTRQELYHILGYDPGGAEPAPEGEKR